jgi:CDP-glucose 4,6-dehydratase
MENMVNTQAFWAGKKVFLTGHTGFKGGWLAIWLHKLGAQVHGFSLNPPTTPSFFDTARVAKTLATDTRGDIRDYPTLEAAMKNANPDVIFHLAAQPLVRASYREPLGTLNTNIMGTAHLLEAARQLSSLNAVLIITTDKCYENREWIYPYREVDPLGGHDPYSASKASAEIVTASYRSSFFMGERTASLATARAGNVIGGGDWAEDRLLPDCIRAFSKDANVELRYPDAVRPWQHVLEPLSGYVMLIEHLSGEGGKKYAEAWNFGPDASNDATVGDIAQRVAGLWGSGKVILPTSCTPPHEAGLLRLDITKTGSRLHWRPRWPIDRTLKETVAWYKAWHLGKDMHDYTLAQIATFEGTA